MNESTTNPSQIPADSEFGTAWHQAADDLGLSVEAPFTLHTAEGQFVFPALIRHFGGPLGTLVLSSAGSEHDPCPCETAHAAGYFVSILGDGYGRYDRQSVIDTLDDWQYFSAQPPPAWYSGKPWTS